MITNEILSRFELFKGLPESLLTEIAALSEEVSVKQGEFVFREGERADKLHFPIEWQRCPACETYLET